MTPAEQIELREQAKADAFTEGQIAGIVTAIYTACDPRDLGRLDERALSLFFEIAYWRRRTVELILEKEQAYSACKPPELPSAQEQDEWRNG